MGSRIDDQADDWWARLHAPDGEKDREEFDAWRSSDPRHAKAFADAEANWGTLAGLKRPSKAAAISRTKPFRRSYALAGLVGVILVATVLMTRMPGFENAARAATVAQSGATLRAYRLSEGSIILLDVHSKVVIDLSGGKRKVALLGGRARFIVVQDAERPFVVSAAGETVTARGTVFDVALSDAGTRVALLRGVVDVAPSVSEAPDAPSLRMMAGQSVAIINKIAKVVPTVEAEQNWPTANLRFESIPLQKLIALANLQGQIPIRLANGVPPKRTVSGTFDIRKSEALAAQLAAALDLTVSRDVTGIILSRKQ